MSFSFTAEQLALVDSVKVLCRRFDDTFWARLDRAREYPDEFVAALTAGGRLAVLIPEEFGGGGGTL